MGKAFAGGAAALLKAFGRRSPVDADLDLGAAGIRSLTRYAWPSAARWRRC